MESAERSRFIIGIDLGTTNTAVAAVDTSAREPRVERCEILQLVAPGAFAPRAQLPSFIYLPTELDLPPEARRLPWSGPPGPVVGELARALGIRQPQGLVASAKSWLCHPGVDRRAGILPWGTDGVARISPVQASALILAHVRDAWDHARDDATGATRFVDQEIILTVPASFDEAARELTLEAARATGLRSVALLEEPQAAFYAWMASESGSERLRPGQRVLVFDVGGGTTDFTLISVGADLGFERTAVGDHLLLGGDNVDLALAKSLEAQLAAGRASRRPLDTVEWHGLVQACRAAKEALLASDGPDSMPIAVSERGSRLIGSVMRAELRRAAVESVLLDGFFPIVAWGDAPFRHRRGLREFGLPYADDPAIPRHLAAFLAAHGGGRIDAVLFNGGAMAAPILRRRVCEQIGRWQPGLGPPAELTARAHEAAVAIGAAYYGLERRRGRPLIAGGNPRAFYVSVVGPDGRAAAVCVASRGMREGETVELEHDFTLLTNRPASFTLYSSTVRDDVVGAIGMLPPARDPASEAAGTPGDSASAGDPGASEFVELPPVVAVLEAPGRGEVIVHIEVTLTALGILEIWCIEPSAAAGIRDEDGPGRWRLSFDMRARASQATSAAAGESGAAGRRMGAVRERIVALFDGGPGALAGVIRQIEETLDLRRNEWPIEIARALFDVALELEPVRARSPVHEARWLQLAGFCLRPGTGAPLDEWRVRSLWQLFARDVIHPNVEECRTAWWIAWRRAAGGLSQDQQAQIYERLAPLFVPTGKPGKKLHPIKAVKLLRQQRTGARPGAEESSEMLRCLASLERLPIPEKLALGGELVRRLSLRAAPSPATALHVWALARVGARAPLYGPMDAVVPPTAAAGWVEALLARDWPEPPAVAFSLALLARRTGDRSRDLDEDLRARVVRWLTAAGVARAVELVAEVVALEVPEQITVLGDTLPPGLRLTAGSGPLNS